jgi:hypothetical protein
MLPFLPFYGIRLPYPLSDPGCAGGEKVRDGVVEMIASNPEAGNEIGGAGGAPGFVLPVAAKERAAAIA